MTTSLRWAKLPRLTSFLLLTAQLGLVCVVSDVFLIEQTYGLNKLIPIIFAGFVIQYWLPLQWRAQFFLLLFPISAFALLGALPSLILIGLGLILFLLCHLPVPIMARAAILVAVGALLAAFRVGKLEMPIPGLEMYFQSQTLPILSAMFMFRTVVYLYDLRHEKGAVSIWQRLGYFFLFPNVCFPLFPVIDYQTYKRTYFNKPEEEIYQRGINWIFRGITHLLLYRIVYHYFVPDPQLIDSFAEVGQYALSSFLLYLRVSGLFHLIIGILCLFGYNLPETHHRYYLSESFTDFWRRINIYWKDFMMKLFYYPIFLRLRGWGMTRAMIAATLITFVITWALHSYQWFWLRGSFPLHPQDMFFWAILAVLVTVNSLYEEKYGRKRKSLTKQARITARDAAIRSFKVVTVFVVICLLWSFWTSASIEQWLRVMSVAATGSALEWLAFFVLYAIAIAFGIALQMYGERASGTSARAESSRLQVAWVGTAGVFLLVIANPAVTDTLDRSTGNLVATITGDQLNTRDQQRLVKGYYEDLLGVENSGSMAWSVRLEKPEDWDWNGLPQSEYALSTNDIRGTAFLPAISMTHKGREFVTNQWGFRGPEIGKHKPNDTHRIAVLGSSYTVGAGVDVELTFPYLLRDHLNNSNHESEADSFEVLNFAYGGDSILRRVSRLQNQAALLDVDIILDMSTTDEQDLALRNLIYIVRHETKDIDPFLTDAVKRAGVTADMSREEIERRLIPFATEITKWGYQQLALWAEQHCMQAAILVLPRTGDTDSAYRDELNYLSQIGEEVGLPVVNLEGVYGPLSDRNNLKLAPWDWHPNAKGHELLGRRIYEELTDLGIMRFASGCVRTEHSSTTIASETIGK